jgi:hypothetical protein
MLLRTTHPPAFLLAILAALTPVTVAGESLHVPACTAYIEPDANGLPVSEKLGIERWSDARKRIAWHGRCAAGRLDATVAVALPAGASATLRLSVAGQERTATVTGMGEQPVMAGFGSYELAQAGWQTLTLDGLERKGETFGRVVELLLDGPALAGAHFNLKPRRNAASVHLGYPTPKDAAITAFYNEVTVRTEPLWSYYMACGFHRGYFGIQVNSASERRVIFSVWDSGNEGVERRKVADDDRVQLLAKGEGVVADDFGNEGTGGHSHLVYPWKSGLTYRFLVTAKPDGTHTVFSGWFHFPERQRWELIASFRAPKDGGPLRGLYSFNEDFIGANGDLRRLAEFGNQWTRTADGAWHELLTARFTHDATGKADRLDYGAGVVDGRFYLSNGGFVADGAHAGMEFIRPATRQPPGDLPPLGS